MKWRGPLFFLARFTYACFFLITSIYCLLTYVPFTYQQVHVGELLPRLTAFVRIHPYVFWLALAVVAPTLVPDLKKSRVVTIGFFVVMAGAGVALVVHPVLRNLGNNITSIYWCLAALLPLLWVAFIDWTGHAEAVPWSPLETSESRRLFQSAWRSALYLAALYALVLYVRGLVAHSMHFSAKQWAWALAWSGLSHLLFFLAMFIVLDLMLGLAGLLTNKRPAEFLGGAVVAAGLVWLVFRSLIFPPLSFHGWLANGVAAALAVVLVAFATGISVRLARADDKLESGLALLMLPLRFLHDLPAWARPAFFVGLAGATYYLATTTARLDWEYLLQKLAVLLVWTLAFAGFYSMQRAADEKRGLGLLYGIAVAVLAAYLGLVMWQPRETEDGTAATEAGTMVDNYANYDVSFRMVDELLSGPGAKAWGEPGEGSFYTFLVENTHIARSRQVSPVDIQLVERLQPTAGEKPDIFIFVIDSLRRDYLGAYNPAVTFTPAFDAFAKDSVVMQNAFTHYGGTGLSEPSIWVGGMMLHKQYVTPFVPMNTLKKLLDAENYDGYVSKDTILETVLGQSPEIHELDAHLATMYYDFCHTLGEVTATLGTRNDPRPVFVYTQPQNIHVSVIDREGRSVPPGASFPPDFDPPYASRVAHLDGCFGEFISNLKKAGKYDNSIIVLTSDHGDSLGERGRWGHAYVIFPEIVRVPLLVHLPPAIKARLAYDPQTVAFLTDITPSLYYLLGQRPIVYNPLFGRPLFTETLGEQQQYEQDAYLVASSYAPVYGELTSNGRYLYVADAVNYKDSYYDLNGDLGAASLPITDQLRAQQRGMIRGQVEAIARFYKLR
jgi:arylsulfatase A-like enzyme